MRRLRLPAFLSILSLSLVLIALIARPTLPVQSATAPTITLVDAGTGRSCGPIGSPNTAVPQRYQITVAGIGLDPSIVAVTVQFASDTPQYGPFRVANGSFSGLIQPFERGFGTYTVTVYPAGNFVAGQSGYPAYFQVPCPTLSIKPPCASVGDRIEISGTGFAPRFPIHLIFVPGAVVLPDVPGGTGTFQIVVAVPNLPPANYQLNATQPNDGPTLTRTATAAIQVPCFNPVLKLIPDVGPPGIVTTAIGTGFPPGAKVDFAWTVGVLPPGVATVVTTGTGTFTFEVLIFPHDTIGARQLVASHDPTAPNFASAMADFLVVQGSVQPNNFSWRH